MITGRDILCISSIEWDFLWQGHQEIAARFAQANNRVLYIENTGVRSPGLRDAGRVAARLKQWGKTRRARGVRQVAPNLYVCAPLVLPPFGPQWRRRLNQRLLLPAVRRAARGLGMRDVIIWTYLPTDTAVDLMRMMRTPHSAVVYYCVADFAQLTPALAQLRQSEAATARLSDLIFAQGPELAGHCAQWNPATHIFPFGVNLDAFPLDATGGDMGQNAAPDAGLDRPRHTFMPEAIQPLARPVIGYIGGLHRHVDFDLLAAMARARPAWSWVFVGPAQTSVAELEGLANVHLLGQQPHRDLARYIQSFDVCIVPYAHNAYTETVVPTKINEYLAVGKPVVATPLPPVCEFNAQHEVILIAPARPDAFLGAIEQALHEPTDAATLERRRAVAALGDWGDRLEVMSQLIEGVLQKKADTASRRS